MSRPAVFFDRDGVLNEAALNDGKPYPPANEEVLCIGEGVAAALSMLKNAGYLIICVTNQPDVARGTRTLENVQAMNLKVKQLLPLDDLFVCLHDNKDKCACRKPKPGMLIEAARKWKIDLNSSWMIGDRAGDIIAGTSAGCRSIFLDRNYAEPPPEATLAYTTCTTVFEAVCHILNLKETIL